MSRPKGILIAIGGHEDKEGRMAVLSRIIDETGKKNPIVEVVTIATSLHEETSEDYFTAFDDLNLDDVGEIYADSRDELNDDRFIKRIEDCDLVFFSGGNQLKLTTILGGTDFMKILKRRYYEDDRFVVAGTSAGATAMSSTMILRGNSDEALIKGKLQLTNGLGFTNNIFIDTHFMERGRFGRLLQTVASNPSVLGLGLGEDTGAIIYEGSDLEIIGSGLAVIVDGLKIKYTDLTEVADGDPITIEGLTIHILAKGRTFLLDERRLSKH